jgi:PAS domain S-box-containing protein
MSSTAREGRSASGGSSVQARLARLQAVLLDLGPDPRANVSVLTALAGELLGGDCAHYAWLEDSDLVLRASWHQHPGPASNRDDASLPYTDVLREALMRACAIRGPHRPRHAMPGPIVRACGYRTWLGHAVQVRGEARGSLCVFWRSRQEPGQPEQALLGVIAAEIGREEDRLWTEQRLREREQCLLATLRAGKHGLFDFHVATGELVVSDDYARMLGYELSDFQPSIEGWLESLHPDDRPAVHALFKECVAGTRDAFSTEYRIRARGGEWRWVRASGAVLRAGDDGRVVRVVGTHTDVTSIRLGEEERLRFELRSAQAQKLESLGVLAGGIAHDFNNLLLAILGNLDLVRETVPDHSNARAGIDQAMSAARRAADLTRQMLAYAGKGTFVLEELDLDQAVRDALPMLQTRVPRHACLELNLCDCKAVVRVDPRQLEQVLLNLVTNAAEAMDKPDGRITLSTGVDELDQSALAQSRIAQLPAAGTFAWIEVADNGSGMDAQTLDRLFDPFFSTRFTGRGLGLAAVHGIVRGHGGAIFVQSELGVGSRIRVALPAVSYQAAVEPRSRGVRSVHAARRTVLIVDDEQPVRVVTSRMVERLGWDYLLASDGVEALDLFREHADRVACVLLDWSMPAMPAADIFRAIRLVRNDVPVIATSGFARTRHHDAPPESIRFLQKPYSLESLRSELECAILRGHA